VNLWHAVKLWKLKRQVEKLLGGSAMSGWKSKAAGIPLILSGLAMFADALINGKWENMNEAILMFSNGLGIIGIAHKIEKGGK